MGRIFMSRPSLMSLTIKYFTRRGYEVKRLNDSDEALTRPKFDFLVSKREAIHPVRVKEWNRTVGVNVVINMDQAAQGSSFSNPILVAEKFSEHAKAYANRRGIILVTRSEILRSLQ
ncbi:hypothetical protein CW712_05570 [Candidatus Bathyarchaeota archaeon]|nr:MAG: hypothetical protein CW712_05570 [Candidatus Bathyarchaeota archaeon]